MAEWQRPSDCDTSGCPEWQQLTGGGLVLRVSDRPGEELLLTNDDRASLVRAAIAGELGPAAVDG